MIVLAEAAETWPEIDVRLCFKLIEGVTFKDELRRPAENMCRQVYYVRRGSAELLNLVRWADVLHVQNMPPDIVFPARVLAEKIFLTVHNHCLLGINLHNLIWNVTTNSAHRCWYNSRFVWGTWERGTTSAMSDCVPIVCYLSQRICPPEQRKGLLFVGRWINYKGIEEILQAYVLSKFSAKDWPLTLLSNGPLKPKVLRLIQELELRDVQMPGFVDDDSKQGYLLSAWWLLAPARPQEDMCLTPIETWSVGVPAIITRDGDLPESGSEAAFITEPSNVADLAQCMQEAAMSTTAYQARGELSCNSLARYLKPINLCRQAYIS